MQFFKLLNVVTAKEAQWQWKRLRDSHREAIRRRRISKGANAKPWKFAKQMEFILHKNTDEEGWPTYMNNKDPLDDLEDRSVSPKCSISTRDKSDVYEPPTAKRQKRLRSDPDPEDSLTSFFDSMCQKTKALPENLRLRVQREVFDSVLKAEEETLSQKTVQYFSPSNSDTCVSDEEPIEIKYSIQND